MRIWRELLAGTTSMQGGFSLAVCDPDHGGPLTQLAREHFGALTPLRAYTSAGQALVDVSQGTRRSRCCRYPSDDGYLVDGAAASRAAAARHRPPAVLEAAAGRACPPRRPWWSASDAAGSQRATISRLLGLECDSDVSRARLSSELAAAGLQPETMVLARHQGAPVANVLVEVEGS